MWETTTSVPDSTRATPTEVARVASAMTARATTIIPEIAWTTQVVEVQVATQVPETTWVTPAATVEMSGSSGARPGGSG